MGRSERMDPQITVDQWLSYMTYSGLNYPFVPSQTLPGSREDIPNSFAGYVQGAYRSNGVVFACMLARLSLFSEARFQYQRMQGGRPGDLFGSPDLDILESPEPGKTTGDLLTRAIQDADLAGNWFGVRNGDRIKRLRPDWVTIVLGSHYGPDADAVVAGDLDAEVIGYAYQPGGPTGGKDHIILGVDQVTHFAPIPDPIASYRGMSWITPVLREIMADSAATSHKLSFFNNGATVNMVVKLDPTVQEAAFNRWIEVFKTQHEGVLNAYKTLYLGGGADVQTVGANFQQMEFKTTQGAGESRIAAAAGVPPVIVGLSEGLQAATYCGTYNEAVWTPRGIVKLGEVVPGDMVWSLVGGGLAPRKVVRHARTGTKPIYAVRTKNRTIRFTDNHPILVRVPGRSDCDNEGRSSSVEWRRVDELRVGDRVVQAKWLPDQGGECLADGSPATPDAMQWLGAYTGDGCLNGDQGVRMCLPALDRVRGYYEALAGRLFTKASSWPLLGKRSDDGLTPEMVRLRGEGLTYKQIGVRMGLSLHPMSVRDRVQVATRDYSLDRAPIEISESRNAFQFFSRQAAQWHHDMRVTGTAKTKRVPAWVFGLREDLRLAYLAGIVDTDGSVGKDGRLTIHFAGQALVEDVRMLLISCGIQCSNIARYQYEASALPNPGLQASYEAWRFVASSSVDVARIPFADRLYRERVETNQHRLRDGGLDAAKAGLNPELGFYTVRSIDIEAAEPVYDIEVEEGHSFLVDGIVVHNSNYAQACRRFADGTMRPLWRNMAGSLAQIIKVPAGARLWYDDRDIAFLREDAKDAAEILQLNAATISSLVNAGYKPETVVSAVMSGDFARLTHTGLYSVQLQPPQTEVPQLPAPSTPASNGKPANGVPAPTS